VQTSKWFKSSLLMVTLLVAAAAFGADKGPLRVLDPVSVSGKQLPAGEYTVKWEGNGPNVQATILKGKTVVATTPARLVDLSSQSPSNASVTRSNPDGSRSLAQIQFGGKKYALSIGADDTQASK
jgi:uncharacterized membrane protein